MKIRKLPLGDMNIIGANITRIREVQKLKQKDLLAKLQAAGLDLNCSSLSKIEGQTRMVSDKELAIFAKVLKVPVGELME